MELDKRIKEGKRPLTCFDIDEARMYVGEKCYICDEYDFFYKLALTEQTILTGVEDCEVPFHYDSDKQGEFCLPCDWVKPEESEKKYRPFSLNEFLNRYRVGNTVYFRRKCYKEVECSMFVGYVKGENTEENQIILGAMRYSLAYLFEHCELALEDTWQPFGVIEDE